MKTALRFVWIFLLLALTFVCRFWNVRDVLLEGHIYFVDGDCYSRMTRAQMIAEHPGKIVRRQDFENWPQGVTAHTTAPLDYLIVALKGGLDGAFRLLDPKGSNLLHDQTLDLAGALVSPLLGLAGAIFLAWWLWKFRVPYGWTALLVYAISPILVHGTLLGRPDHQSLLMTLITVAIGAELALAGEGEAALSLKSERNWGIVGGIAWGMSLWVSLYEPVILLAVVLVLWVWLARRRLSSRARLPGAAVFGAILLLSLGMEGWSVALPNAEVRTYFPNWEKTIGELQHMHLALLFQWVGWIVVATPFLLAFAWRQDRRALPLLVLVAVTLLLTIWQARWGYFLGVVFAWTLPWQMQALRRLVDGFFQRRVGAWHAVLRWCLIWPLFVAGLWPIFQDWDAHLYQDDLVEQNRALKRAELVALRDVAVDGVGASGGPFLAAWWLSPAVAYWSHQPSVAGTSHESLPGIVATARFFLSPDSAAGAVVLHQRPVRWVIAGDPTQEIDTSSSLLGEKPPADPLATVIFERPEDGPEYLHEWVGTAGVHRGLRFYRLFEVDETKVPHE